MKTIIISLATLAALSTAGMANDRSDDFTTGDRVITFGASSSMMQMSNGISAGFVAVEGASSVQGSDAATEKLRGNEYIVERGSNRG